MNTKNLKEKMKKTLPALLLCGTVGLGALAWLVDTDITDNKENLSAGRLSVVFENEASAYNDLNTLPTSRDTALAGTPYTFTVRNDGTVDEMVRLAATKVEGWISSGLVNVVIQTEDGLTTIYDGTLAGFNEVYNETIVTKYMKITDELGEPEFYDDITGLVEGVDYEIVQMPEIAGYNSASGEVLSLASGESINLKMYAWVDESATKDDLYYYEEEGGELIGGDKNFNLKAFAIQEQDTFVAETEDNTLEMQWDALDSEVVFDELF